MIIAADVRRCSTVELLEFAAEMAAVVKAAVKDDFLECVIAAFQHVFCSSESGVPDVSNRWNTNFPPKELAEP